MTDQTKPMDAERLAEWDEGLIAEPVTDKEEGE